MSDAVHPMKLYAFVDAFHVNFYILTIITYTHLQGEI